MKTLRLSSTSRAVSEKEVYAQPENIFYLEAKVGMVQEKCVSRRLLVSVTPAALVASSTAPKRQRESGMRGAENYLTAIITLR
jgi:hypothetical protein